jgi:hypothetical protein
MSIRTRTDKQIAKVLSDHCEACGYKVEGKVACELLSRPCDLKIRLRCNYACPDGRFKEETDGARTNNVDLD